jgi:hypothetical protein
MPYRPASRQTKHHSSGRRVSPSGPSTMSRRFYPACIRPDVSAARPDPSQYSISFWFLSKFQEREDQSTVRTMWYPVRTRVSLRQESQFKYHRLDVWQLWSGRAFIKEGNCRFDFNRTDDCLSWFGRVHCIYGNWVLKNSRPDAHPPWSGRAKPDKEITCSGCATVRTMYHPVQTRLLNRKDFLAKFSENLVAQLSVLTAHVHRPDGAQVYFAWHSFEPPAYK